MATGRAKALEVRDAEQKTASEQEIDYHELKVAMRALGFDLKKAEVLKIMRDADKLGTQRMGFDDFVRVSKCPMLHFVFLRCDIERVGWPASQ